MARARHVLWLAMTTSAVLFACNGILGIVEVSRREADGGDLPDRETPDGPLPPDDGGGNFGPLQVSLGLAFSCAKDSRGFVKCWGDNSLGQVGTGSFPDGSSFVLKPSLVVNLTDAIQLGAGDSHVCAVKANGKIMCWGANGFGQLGDG